jgi:peptidoglycan/xylan/chitin deacetylase (PgdA/CDA1 family)
MNGLKEVPFASIEDGLRALESKHDIAPLDPAELFLTSSDVRSLASDGVTFGSHTHRHPILRQLSPEDQRFELETSAGIIEQVTGRAPLEFAYPNGSPLDFDDITVSALRKTGYSVSVTTTQRYVRPTDDPFRIPRIGVVDGESAFHMLAKGLVPSLSRSHERERRARERRSGGRS